jgi:hypothetical protein
MSIGLKGNTDGSGAIQVGGSDAITISTGLVVTMNGGVQRPLISGTSATASGTSVDFLNVPSWVKRITVMLDDVSLTTTASNIGVRIGSGSFEATGYVGGFILVNNTSTSIATFTTLFGLAALNLVADTINGALVITNVSGNLWVSQGNFFRDSTGVDAGYAVAGSKTTSGVLDRLQIMLDSTGAFDGGTVNILYE